MDFIESVAQAGVVGAGGAGFPTHVKIKAKAEYLLINAAECEPLIETDKFLCREFPDLIVATVVKMKEHLGASHAVLVLKDHYHREIEALEKAISAAGAEVEIFKIRTFYPAGDEQTIVQQVTGRCVPERGLPLDVGCVVDNVGTVLSIADALEERPVSMKYLSVTGDVNKPSMYHVPVGTPITDVLEKAGVNVAGHAVIMGGPMMGKMLKDEESIRNAVVTKTTGNLLVLPMDHYLVRRDDMSIPQMIHQASSACIQCRMCTDLCPRYLLGHNVIPNMVMRNVWKEGTITDEEEYIKAFGSAENCVNCGACELFSCPMGLSPRKMNNYMKGKLRERGITTEKNTSPVARRDVDIHKIPTERLIARLDLSKYVSHELPELTEYMPEECIIPTSQHIGKPAAPVVKQGDTVKAGDLVAAAAEGLSANIHTGMSGVVTLVDERGIHISRKEV